MVKTAACLVVFLSLFNACKASPVATAAHQARSEETQSQITHTVFLPLVTPGPRTTPEYWRPQVLSTWQIQLNSAPDTSVEAQVYDIDLFDNSAQTVAALKNRGRHVICYVSAGSWEDWRPDASQFPPEVIGKDYAGWAGEKWLDIRRIDLLAPILRARFDQCKGKGFEGIDPDNVDGYQNDTGFPLTAQDQLNFNTWLANEAHVRGLSIGLKNDPEQALPLLSYFDWALTEDCFDQGWCDMVSPFIQQLKPVFAIEYTDTGAALDEICPQAKTLQFSLVLKNRELDSFRQICP